MTSIPVAWLISFLALLLAAITLRQERMPAIARMSFGVGMVSVAVVAVFVGVRFLFAAPAIVVFQPYFAALTAPALWLGFHVLTIQSGVPKRIVLLALAGTIVTVWGITSLPGPSSPSIAIIFINTLFAVRMFSFFRLPSDRFVHVSPQRLPTLRSALVGCLVFLLLLIVTDVSVLVTELAAGEVRAMALLSNAAAAVVVTVSVGVLVGLSLAFGVGNQIEDEAREDAQPLDEDRTVFAQLEALMEEASLFRDPDITVARLGRRLGVPARSVSSAVNRVTGENTSRYINGLRVQHAIRLLEQTSLPVTDVMLESGFTSKSNFNTEFRRIVGKTPSDHRKSQELGALKN